MFSFFIELEKRQQVIFYAYNRCSMGLCLIVGVYSGVACGLMG